MGLQNKTFGLQQKIFGLQARAVGLQQKRLQKKPLGCKKESGRNKETQRLQKADLNIAKITKKHHQVLLFNPLAPAWNLQIKYWGCAQGGEPKGTNANLRFSADSCKNEWFSAKSCVSQMLCFLGKGENLQKSAKISVWARLVPLGSSP